MLNEEKNNNRTEEFSGLALALLLDRCFIDLFDLCENNEKPIRRLRSRQSLLAKKRFTRGAHKEVYLGRF